MLVKFIKNKIFFFKDDAYVICEYCGTHFASRFDELELDKFIEHYDKYLDGEYTPFADIFLENKLTTDDTGLIYALWVDPAGNKRNVSHNSPRIKVIYHGKQYPLLFADEIRFAENTNPPPELERYLDEIAVFIHDNKRELLAQWYGHFNSFKGFQKAIRDNQIKKGKIKFN